MRKYMSIFNSSHEKLIESINRYYYADLDHSDGCPLLGVIVVNEPDSEPVIYLR